MADVDVYMYRAFDQYKKGEFGFESEYGAYEIADLLAKEGDEVAARVKETMLTQAQRQALIDINSQYHQHKATVGVFQNQLDRFNQTEYENTIRWYGLEKANTTRNEFTQKLEKAKTEEQNYTLFYDAIIAKIKREVPDRIARYEDAKIGPNKRNPIQQMNQVIIDISNASPEYSPQASQMTQQVHSVHDHFLLDLKYRENVNEVITDLSNNILSQVERDLQFKKKQMDIQEYYAKNYQQQIFLLKILVVFSLFALIGGLLLNYRLISVTLFAMYLGMVLSVGFIVMFYYLWDFYIRDNTVFDEYNFLIYNPPPKPALSDLPPDFKDNIIYC